MRYAIVSDIHANWQAWSAVLEDLTARKADAVLCLGDVVGYGPDPAPVLESVTSRAQVVLLGNHDAALCGLMDDELFNDTARGIIRWTRGQLDPKAVQAMRQWPLLVEGDGFGAAHGEFVHPDRFHYVETPEDAGACWRAAGSRLLLVGHTHEPVLFARADRRIPRRLPPQDFTVEPGHRYLVNPGSVSQSRDGDPRASYCLYDTVARTLTFCRVAFDYEAHRRACEAAGLPPLMTGFLTPDPRRDAAGARPKIIYFRPAESGKTAAHGAVQKKSAGDDSRRRARRRAIAMTLSLTALAVAGAAVVVTRNLLGRGRAQTPASAPAAATVVRAADFAPGKNILPGLTRPTEPGESIFGWIVRPGDEAAQSAVVAALADRSLAFDLRSSSAEAELAVESVPLIVERNSHVLVEARFRPDAAFAGTVGLALSGRRTPGGPVETLAAREPAPEAENGWRTARLKLDLRSEIHDLQVRLSGRFRGKVEVAGVSFSCEPGESAGAADPADDWSFSGGLRIVRREPALELRSSGYDPQMTTRKLPDGFPGPHTVELRMKSQAAGEGRVYWSVPSDTDFSSQRRVKFTVSADGQWKDYVLRLNSKGILAGLRLHPAANPGEISIERIAIKDADGRIAREWNFAGGTPPGAGAASAVAAPKGPAPAADHRAGWKIAASSFEPGEGLVEHAIDGRPDTFWHSRWTGEAASHPHWITVDFGRELVVAGVKYLPRQERVNGRVKDYEISVSSDGKDWGQPVARGSFEDRVEEQIAKIDPPLKARHLKFVATSEVRGQRFTTIAEFDVVEAK